MKLFWHIYTVGWPLLIVFIIWFNNRAIRIIEKKDSSQHPRDPR